jgi:sialate O-acetylesterase
MRLRTTVLAGTFSILCLCGWGDVTCACPFTDNMVLQRDAAVRVWGMADPGERVTVEIAGDKQSAAARADGAWQVTLAKHAAGGPHTMVVSGNNRLEFNNVLFGEVWLCSGQSNMWMTLASTANPEQAIQSADLPQIRLFPLPRTVSAVPLTTCTAVWKVCSPAEVTSFSAVAFYFGSHLHEKLGVPVGLIHSSFGGSPAEAWTPEETLRSDPDLAPALKMLEEYTRVYPDALDKYERAREEYQARRRAGRATGSGPSAPTPPDRYHRAASVLYNGMIAPLIPYTIRGAIWYQGEANHGRAWVYRKLLPAMVEAWRDAWKQGDFPFLIVQLANDGRVTPEWMES